MSLFEPKDETVKYGWFGYEGAMLDRAISTKNAAQMKEAHERGWISHKTEVLGGYTLRRHCRNKKAVACDQVLAELGYPE